MARKKDAAAQQPDAAAGEQAEAPGTPAAGPSVAAHPRAARNVARAKGWGGLLGFLVGGYLSLPTSTLAAAGLRALVAGVVCYVATWAGAVFVWRQIVMLELAGARARSQQRLVALARASAGDSRGPSRRENVRVKVRRPVVAYVGADRSPAQTYTIDISAGGLLVAGLADLQKGEPFEFELALTPGEPPVTGKGTVVRTDSQGRCAIVFKSIARSDARRLDQFVFEYLRNERQGEAA